MGKIQIMSNKKLISSIITASLFLFVLSPLHASVYRWVDENGQVHYGEQPGNTGAEEVIIRQNETTKPRPINKAEEDAAESGNENTEQQAEVPAVPEAPKISKKEKRRLCNKAKNDIASINSRGRLREINKKGEYVYLTEQQRQKRLSDARKKQRENCH